MRTLADLSSALSVAARHSTLAQSLRLLSLRSTPIADAPHGGLVRIDGIAVARDDQGALVAPCGGSAAVWFRLRVLRRVEAGGPGGRLWLTVIDEKEAVGFDVLDDRGARATIVTTDARVAAEPRAFALPVAGSGRAATRPVLSLRAMERVGQFLEQRGHTNWLGDLYEESTIGPGDRVTVAGSTRRGVTGATPYREPSSTGLVVEGTATCSVFIARSVGEGLVGGGRSGSPGPQRLRLFWRSLGSS